MVGEGKVSGASVSLLEGLLERVGGLAKAGSGRFLVQLDGLNEPGGGEHAGGVIEADANAVREFSRGRVRLREMSGPGPFWPAPQA